MSAMLNQFLQQILPAMAWLIACKTWWQITMKNDFKKRKQIQ